MIYLPLYSVQICDRSQHKRRIDRLQRAVAVYVGCKAFDCRRITGKRGHVRYRSLDERGVDRFDLSVKVDVALYGYYDADVGIDCYGKFMFAVLRRAGKPCVSAVAVSERDDAR